MYHMPGPFALLPRARVSGFAASKCSVLGRALGFA